MISVKTMVRLTTRVDDLCPRRWRSEPFNQACSATGFTHLCVGDAGHRGKHVCPCGALRAVKLA